MDDLISATGDLSITPFDWGDDTPGPEFDFEPAQSDDYADDENQTSFHQSPQSMYTLPGIFSPDGTSLVRMPLSTMAYTPPLENEEYDQVPELVGPISSRKYTRTKTASEGFLLNEDLTRYVIQPPKKFQFGTVFKVMWSEPMGDTRLSRLNQHDVQTPPSAFSIGLSALPSAPLFYLTSPSSISTSVSSVFSRPSSPVSTSSSLSEFEIRSSPDGTTFYEGIRRFIVVDGTENGARNGNSICIPIATYKRQACTRRGIKPDHHGIIHMHNKQPLLLNNEPDLGFDPIRLIVGRDLEKDENLAPESRINYAKHVTIEHNACVYIIGHIHPDDLEILASAVDTCWEQRIRNRKKLQRQERPRR